MSYGNFRSYSVTCVQFFSERNTQEEIKNFEIFFLLVSKVFNKVKVLNSFYLKVYFFNVYQKYFLHVVRYVRYMLWYVPVSSVFRWLAGRKES